MDNEEIDFNELLPSTTKEEIPMTEDITVNADQTMNELISSDNRSVKRCKYPTCDNTISADSTFEYCEKCRSLAARNAIALCIDPCCPNELERRYEVTQTLLHNMTGEEILRTATRIETIYLEFQKTIISHNISQNVRKPFKPLPEQIEEARNKNTEAASTEKRLRSKADKKIKQRVDRIDSLKKLLGTEDTDAVKKFMDEEIDL
jgi:hypothetical protein